ncbi:hypothetical protein SL103_18650 [Streptomyces lydicus]|uniref:Uncharacterized protein n=1 Tax=Streptomyces lydicus TaxID=47763 RepID=A0A1D7VMK9_9ACTN|nr:hypothetical protein [Streptomyces lydicus]AOP47984.1 hypothetical protein SL103_18650 [Streptomyces lydicus]
MGAAHTLGGPHLALEALPELGVPGELGADHLHRGWLPARGQGEEHLPHAALSQPRHQPEVP